MPPHPVPLHRPPSPTGPLQAALHLLRLLLLCAQAAAMPVGKQSKRHCLPNFSDAAHSWLSTTYWRTHRTCSLQKRSHCFVGEHGLLEPCREPWQPTRQAPADFVPGMAANYQHIVELEEAERGLHLLHLRQLIMHKCEIEDNFYRHVPIRNALVVRSCCHE